MEKFLVVKFFQPTMQPRAVTAYELYETREEVITAIEWSGMNTCEVYELGRKWEEEEVNQVGRDFVERVEREQLETLKKKYA